MFHFIFVSSVVFTRHSIQFECFQKFNMFADGALLYELKFCFVERHLPDVNAHFDFKLVELDRSTGKRSPLIK